MWVRKTAKEIKNDNQIDKIQRNSNPIIPPAIGLVGALMGLVYMSSLENFLVLFFGTTFLAYIVQYFFKDALGGLLVLVSNGLAFSAQPTDICSSCFEVKDRANKKVCHCGGTLEPLENWKWIEKP